MNCIYDNKENKTNEQNLLDDIINSSKQTKNINSH